VRFRNLSPTEVTKMLRGNDIAKSLLDLQGACPQDVALRLKATTMIELLKEGVTWHDLSYVDYELLNCLQRRFPSRQIGEYAPREQKSQKATILAIARSLGNSGKPIDEALADEIERWPPDDDDDDDDGNVLM